jgi:hypothetical protein
MGALTRALRNENPSDSTLETFVFGTKEAALPPTLPFVASPAPAPTPASTPTASLISVTLPTLRHPQHQKHLNLNLNLSPLNPRRLA